MTFVTMIRLWPLLIGLALIGLAVGVQGSLLGIRAEIEGFEDYLIGLLMSCYFAGFLAGSLLTPKMIHRVGHIRIFAALSAVASVTILIHSIYVNPWGWAFMRLLTGFAFSTIYVVAESWLNQASSNETRGQILAIYTAILLSGICAGQFMLNIADPAGHTPVYFDFGNGQCGGGAYSAVSYRRATTGRNRTCQHRPSMASHTNGGHRHCALAMGLEHYVWHGGSLCRQARIYDL